MTAYFPVPVPDIGDWVIVRFHSWSATGGHKFEVGQVLEFAADDANVRLDVGWIVEWRPLSDVCAVLAEKEIIS